MDLKKIREWLIKRFGRTPEQDQGYFDEWVRRFRTGWALSYMDHKSTQIWLEMK